MLCIIPRPKGHRVHYSTDTTIGTHRPKCTPLTNKCKPCMYIWVCVFYMINIPSLQSLVFVFQSIGFVCYYCLDISPSITLLGLYYRFIPCPAFSELIETCSSTNTSIFPRTYRRTSLFTAVSKETNIRSKDLLASLSSAQCPLDHWPFSIF